MSESTTFDQRVLLERAELQDRLTNLRHFLESRKFSELTEAEQSRLTRQWRAMSDYVDVLTERLDADFK